ncbi:MAG: alpha/beta fold hydrolase [Clostridiales Family XIII bacterium]|jgi:pimeloyl-ACP methyl ester carboxylesterase|nr:alpha/beta fold hydrolase [Clostridiales Family XIII bacterium]
MTIRVDQMFVDRDWTDEPDKPSAFGTFIEGDRGRIFSQVYVPGGSGPHPAVIFCHGLPGNERLFDFAVILRNMGYCTISFHYGGSWGSDGAFSIGGCLRDAESVARYVAENKDGIFDTKNVFVVGHSLGGMIAAYILATNPDLKAGSLIMPANICGIYRAAQESEEAGALFRLLFDGFGEWLNGFSWDTFADEAKENPDRFALATYAGQLSAKPLLLIAGSMDADLPREENIDLLAAAIKEIDGGKLKELTLDTDHGIGAQRYTAIRTVAEFFESALS